MSVDVNTKTGLPPAPRGKKWMVLPWSFDDDPMNEALPLRFHSSKTWVIVALVDIYETYPPYIWYAVPRRASKATVEDIFATAVKVLKLNDRIKAKRDKMQARYDSPRGKARRARESERIRARDAKRAGRTAGIKKFFGEYPPKNMMEVETKNGRD